ncbi:NAD(P)-binding domain-containing protein [Rhodococcus jostii]|uniref:NAD(P)-binding domain-containing protein n=1 Tax=Rhodococcus jostii TaxID=132919 RepID=UPI003638E8DC
MGTAVAQALAKSGRDTAVWNRTISRAEPLAKAGVSVHADVGSALDASDAIVLTILDLDSALKTLDGHFAALEGKAVINLMSGTPALARETAQRVEEVGARYLDGTIQCYPSDIGAAEALINLSGDRAVWDAYKDAIMAVAGRSTYVGEDPGAASILDAALAGTVYTAGPGAFCEALAFLRDSNIDPTRPEVALDYWFDLFRAQAMQLVDYVAQEGVPCRSPTVAKHHAGRWSARQHYGCGAAEPGDRRCSRVRKFQLRRASADDVVPAEVTDTNDRARKLSRFNPLD